MKDKPDYIQRSLWEAGSRSRISALQKLLTYKLNDVYSHQYASCGGMLIAYRSTCRPTIGQPLSVDISTVISVECQSTYRPMLDRYVDRYVGWLSVDMSTDMSVEGCTKYTWSSLSCENRMTGTRPPNQCWDQKFDNYIFCCYTQNWHPP